jgi:predicted helicase
LAASYDGFQGVPRHRFTPEGKVDNVTDWGLRQFKNRYEVGKGNTRKGSKSPLAITKDAIFRYVYAALHDPLYREAYAQNLKREFPRVPMHEDFWKWVAWGERLLELHTGYKDAEPWNLIRRDAADKGHARPAFYRKRC